MRYRTRRAFMVGALTAVFARPVMAQLLKTPYTEEGPTINKLHNAKTIGEVLQIATDWDDVYHNAAGVVGEKYQTDYDKIVETIKDEIKSKIKDEATKVILIKIAPKLLKVLTKAEALLEGFAPMFVALSIFFDSSDTASDAYEIEQSDIRVQREVSAAIGRIEGAPHWYDAFKAQLNLPPSGPVIRQD